MPRKKQPKEEKWTVRVISKHIENGRKLYEQLSEESVREIEDDTEGSARKAAIQAKADAWDRANELFMKIARLEERYEQASEEQSILTKEEKKEDFKEGWSERMAN